MTMGSEGFMREEDGIETSVVRYYQNFPYTPQEAAEICDTITEGWMNDMFPEGFGYAFRIGMVQLPTHPDKKRHVKMFYFTVPLFADGIEPTDETIDSLYAFVEQRAIATMRTLLAAHDCDFSATILNPPPEMLASLEEHLDFVQ